MTISSTAPRNDYIGTGAVDTYDYIFRIIKKTDLLVIIEDDNGFPTIPNPLVVDTDFTVSGVGSYTGGTITLTAGNLTLNYTLTIKRKVVIEQTTDLRNQGGYFPETVEDMSDYLTMISQRFDDILLRALLQPETEVGTGDFILPTVDNRKDRVLAFDGSGDPVAVTNYTGSVAISAFAETLLDDASAAAMHATLFNSYIQSLVADATANQARATLGVRSYATTSGTDTYTASPGISGYVAGETYMIDFGNANTVTNPTINLDAQGAVDIVLRSGRAVAIGQLLGLHDLFYDGTDMLVLTLPRYNFRGALVTTTGQTISNITITKVTWDGEDYDTDSIHDNVTNNTRLTVPSGVTRVRIRGQVFWATSTVGDRIGEIYKNNSGSYVGYSKQNTSAITGYGAAGSNNHSQAETPIIDVVAGDYFEFLVWQDTGGNLNVSSAASSWFFMEIIE